MLGPSDLLLSVKQSLSRAWILRPVAWEKQTLWRHYKFRTQSSCKTQGFVDVEERFSQGAFYRRQNLGELNSHEIQRKNYKRNKFRLISKEILNC